MTETPRNEQIRDELLRWVAEHRTMLGAYVYAIVRDSDVTNDVLGELTVVIARKGGEFDPARPIAPLMRGIARNLSLRVIRARARNRIEPTDPVLLDEISDEIHELDHSDAIQERKNALRRCMETLPNSRRRLLELRYFKNFDYEKISQLVKKSANSLHVRMYRIHQALAECMRRRLSEGGMANG